MDLNGQLYEIVQARHKYLKECQDELKALNKDKKKHSKKSKVKKGPSSSHVTFDNSGVDDEANKDTKNHGTVDLLDDTTSEDDVQDEGAKRQRHKTAILDPSYSSPTKIKPPVANDDAQVQLDSFSEELGLHECHHLAFSMQFGRLYTPRKRGLQDYPL
jgi:hypothetical protein